MTVFLTAGGTTIPLKTDFIYSLLTFKTSLYIFSLISKGVLRLTTVGSILLLPYPVSFIIFLNWIPYTVFHVYILRTWHYIFPLLFINLHNVCSVAHDHIDRANVVC